MPRKNERDNFKNRWNARGGSSLGRNSRGVAHSSVNGRESYLIDNRFWNILSFINAFIRSCKCN